MGVSVGQRFSGMNKGRKPIAPERRQHVLRLAAEVPLGRGWNPVPPSCIKFDARPRF